MRSIYTWIWLIPSRLVFKLPNPSRVILDLAFKGCISEVSSEWLVYSVRFPQGGWTKLLPLSSMSHQVLQLPVTSATPWMLPACALDLCMDSCIWTAVHEEDLWQISAVYSRENPYFLIPCLESQLCQQLRTPGSYFRVQLSRCAVWAHFLGMKLTKTHNQEAWVLLELTFHCMNSPCPVRLLSSIWKQFTWFHTSWWHETESVISYLTVERSRKLLIFKKKNIFWKFYLFERETKSMRQEREIMSRSEG